MADVNRKKRVLRLKQEGMRVRKRMNEIGKYEMRKV
jgi:hypothetical protein